MQVIFLTKSLLLSILIGIIFGIIFAAYTSIGPDGLVVKLYAFKAISSIYDNFGFQGVLLSFLPYIVISVVSVLISCALLCHKKE